jgi:hypothetical protein
MNSPKYQNSTTSIRSGKTIDPVSDSPEAAVIVTAIRGKSSKTAALSSRKNRIMELCLRTKFKKWRYQEVPALVTQA